ncbi:hypothetical protein ACLMJK_002462 [Lecanora helva]
MDPLSAGASTLAVVGALKKTYDVLEAAHNSEKDKAILRDTLDGLRVQVDLLQDLEKRALSSPDDPRYAGFRALLNSSKQIQNGKNVEPDPSGKSPGVLQRLVDRIEGTRVKLQPKHGFRAGARRLRWFHESKEFKNILAEIKESTEIVNSVLHYDHYLTSLGTDDRVKHLEIEAAEAAEARRRAAEREEKRAMEKSMKLKETQRLEIVRWISPLKFRERHYAILNQAPSSITKPDLLQTEEFDAWSRSRQWILHCEGKPGAGKTLLCALVGKYLDDMAQSEGKKVPVLLMYLNYKERDSQSLSNLFASLLKQLIQHPGDHFQSKQAQSLYEGPDSESRPTWKRFFEAFCAEVAFYDRVFIIVDALDEASLDVAPRLLDALQKLSKTSDSHASVMVTSQRTEDSPPPDFFIQCDRCQKKPLQAYYQCQICNDGRFYLCEECLGKGRYCEDTTHDLKQPAKVIMSIEPTNDEIQHYIRSELQTELELGRFSEDDNYPSTLGTTPLGRLCMDNPSLQDKITSSIVAKADGMFALAQLYLSSLKSLGLSALEISDMLDNPPEGYHGLYEQHMARIGEESLGTVGSNVGISALMWVVCACRPLKFFELQDALAVNFRKSGFFNASARRDKATIIRATAGLLTIDNNDHDAAVRLSHQTAQQYFDSDRDRWFSNASAQITRVSLHYLGLKDLASPGEGDWEDKQFEMRQIDYPFLRYAYQYWGDHANDAISDSASQSEIMRFVSDPDKVAAAIQALWYLKSEADVDWDVRKGANALHICAWFGLDYAISELLQNQGMEIDSRDPKHEQTPLMYACRRGKISTVALLLDRGARVNAISKRGNTALFEALFPGHTEVIEMLLARSNLDINTSQSRRSNQTALMIAAQEGKVDIVRALLSCDGIEVYRVDANRNTALSNAIISDQTDTAMEILKYGGNPDQLNSTNWTGSSALILAASRGQEDIVESLLRNGANASIKDKEGGGTALLRAIDDGHEGVVKCMLKYEKIDVHVLDDYGRGLLHGAAIGGHINIVQLLLDQGLNINVRDKKGKTPLHEASQIDAFQIVQLLVSRHADASLEDNAGRTAWTVAWQHGCKTVMKVLDGKDPYDLTEEDLSGTYPDAQLLPIWALARMRFEDEVTEAIATRSKREIRSLDPDTDNTALHCAVLADGPEIVQQLLKAGLSAEAKNEYHRTPLFLAAQKGNDTILKLLLATSDGEEDAGAVDTVDRWGTSPVLAAQSNGHVMCCLFLLEAGATIPASKASVKQSLFFSAIENGKLDAVQRLAQMGADLQAKNVLGLTGLQMAKEAGKGDVERFLRKSKTKVEGLRISLEGMRNGHDEVSEVAAVTPDSLATVPRSLERSPSMGEGMESPAPSLEERLKALEVPSSAFRSRISNEADPQSNSDYRPRPAKIAQLA